MAKNVQKQKGEIKMTEREVDEMAKMEKQLQPQPTETDIPADLARNKPRDTRKLRWYERQYGAGFLNGLWCGIALGLPLAAGVAALCKVFVGWLMAL